MGDYVITIKLGGVGHLRRQIEAIRDGLTLMVEKLEKVETTYCMDCGTELEFKSQLADSNGRMETMKWCPNCDQVCRFRDTQKVGEKV
ncbi:MAG: hypothetical protein HPY52_10675 [Firmicutes bacterium]|nr:hypothetical protein [Bacillota bacterium]